MKHFCTCRKDKMEHSHHHTATHETEVDSHGICTNCGYYAIAQAPDKSYLFNEECLEDLESINE